MTELNQEPIEKEEQATETEAIKENRGLKAKINKRNAAIIIITVAALFITFNVGKAAGINSEIADIKIQQDEAYQEASKKLDAINEETKEKKDSLIAADKYYENKEILDKELTEGTATFEKLTEDNDNLTKEVGSKRAQLEKLTGDIVKAKGNPVKLSAGNFTAGKDIATGRYKVTGDSNFAVYDGFGSLKVNTILGGKYGVESYVCELDSGDTLQCSGSDTFTPIE